VFHDSFGTTHYANLGYGYSFCMSYDSAWTILKQEKNDVSSFLTCSYHDPDPRRIVRVHVMMRCKLRERLLAFQDVQIHSCLECR
jgi:hypothetical protein